MTFAFDRFPSAVTNPFPPRDQLAILLSLDPIPALQKASLENLRNLEADESMRGLWQLLIDESKFKNLRLILVRSGVFDERVSLILQSWESDRVAIEKAIEYLKVVSAFATEPAGKLEKPEVPQQ